MLFSEMCIHILVIALFCCGSADSRKVRGISSSCKFSFTALTLMLAVFFFFLDFSVKKFLIYCHK